MHQCRHHRTASTPQFPTRRLMACLIAAKVFDKRNGELRVIVIAQLDIHVKQKVPFTEFTSSNRASLQSFVWPASTFSFAFITNKNRVLRLNIHVACSSKKKKKKTRPGFSTVLLFFEAAALHRSKENQETI